jgi:hypothetical protein
MSNTIEIVTGDARPVLAIRSEGQTDLRAQISDPAGLIQQIADASGLKVTIEPGDAEVGAAEAGDQ